MTGQEQLVPSGALQRLYKPAGAKGWWRLAPKATPAPTFLLEKPMATYNVLAVTRTAGSRNVTSTDRDGSSVTLDTACGTSGICLVLNETVLKASNPAGNISSVAEELLEELRSALHNQTRV
jgi:hypothetical protein